LNSFPPFFRTANTASLDGKDEEGNISLHPAISSSQLTQTLPRGKFRKTTGDIIRTIRLQEKHG
jgi:hypothetical protein